MNKYLFSLALFLASTTQALEFLYPVALFPDNTIGFIYQRSAEKIELYRWDYIKKNTEQSLYSRFCPAHISLLPGNQGFSFIDNGIIRVKFFHKRSPKSLEIAEPLYNINYVHWEKNWEKNGEKSACYFCAKQKNHYAIFEIDIEAQVKKIIFCSDADFLYPQKVGDYVFFIQRSMENMESRYAVSMIKFDSNFNYEQEKIKNETKKIDKNFDHVQIEKIASESMPLNILVNRDEGCLIDFGNQPIYFLEMETASLGYVIAYESLGEQELRFSYHRLTQEDGEWRKKKLFDFAIPASFLLPESADRLYEHMLPLLPKKFDDGIYYAHTTYQKTGNINIFKYSLDTGSSEQITFACQPDEHYFCPLKVGDHIYYGGSIFKNY